LLQAYADVIFKVCQHEYPDIGLETENMYESVAYVVKRDRDEADSEKEY